MRHEIPYVFLKMSNKMRNLDCAIPPLPIAVPPISNICFENFMSLALTRPPPPAGAPNTVRGGGGVRGIL